MTSSFENTSCETRAAPTIPPRFASGEPSNCPPSGGRAHRPAGATRYSPPRDRFRRPFVALRRLVDLVAREISADRGNVAKGYVATLRELLCAMNPNQCPAPVEFIAQLKAFFRGGCDIRRRNETRVHLTLLNAEGL